MHRAVNDALRGRRRLPARGLLALVLALPAACFRGDAPADETETTGETTGATGDTTGEGSAGSESAGDDDAGPPLAPQPLHRLNRLEYNNTVRDLLGTSLRPADAFGPDPEANGFDNMAAQLRVTPSLLEAYDRAAREVIDDALDDVPAFVATFRGDDLAVVGGYPVGELWALSGQPLTLEVAISTAIDAEIVVDAGITVGGTAPAPIAHLQVNGVDLPPFAVGGSAAIPAAHVQPLNLAAGTHTIALIPNNYVNLPAENNFNNIFVARVAVRSTAQVRGPGYDRVYVCEPAGPDDHGCYAEILENFARRAWRRPPAEADVAELVDLWADLMAQGETADGALRLVMRGVMLSPRFLYRARTTADGDREGWLDDYVLASRLSYFLWSSMPDERLLAMAGEGRLASDEGLSEAVAWMLDDPKAAALLDGFAEQWLVTRHLATYNPDADTYPDFDEAVRAAMTAESKLFFGDFFHNNLAVSALIRPDFTHRNDRLAAHYGVEPVGSSVMLRVPVAGDGRRGLLELGAWLTATSEAAHSSPIRRGRWVAERLLCSPIPPPPPGLVFEPPDLEGAESVREALERHRDDPACSSCHALLDVLGIGFEEYNAIGQPVDDPEVDNLGELPSGQTFAGAAALAEIYADDAAFVDCFTRTLFTYAVGRPITGGDVAPLREAAAAAHAAGQTLPQLIDAMVHTPGFRSPGPLNGGR